MTGGRLETGPVEVSAWTEHRLGEVSACEVCIPQLDVPEVNANEMGLSQIDGPVNETVFAATSSLAQLDTAKLARPSLSLQYPLKLATRKERYARIGGSARSAIFATHAA
ncbi:MAG TPA: hypothetical protein VGP82_02970 [Ktedonobacterales bacterium]|nr:hypothetical protein [Ktedonobacterales bacterium]